MEKINEVHVPHNTGWAGELKQDQVIRISATTTVDFVCLRRQNLRERFDQARTKVYNMKLFITTGDKLMGRNNQHMMTILADGFKEGTHDVQRLPISARQTGGQTRRILSAANQRDSRSRLL